MTNSTAHVPDDRELDEILSLLGTSNVPDTNGQFSEVDPLSIRIVRQRLADLISQKEVEARIDCIQQLIER